MGCAGRATAGVQCGGCLHPQDDPDPTPHPHWLRNNLLLDPVCQHQCGHDLPVLESGHEAPSHPAEARPSGALLLPVSGDDGLRGPRQAHPGHHQLHHLLKAGPSKDR